MITDTPMAASHSSESTASLDESALPEVSPTMLVSTDACPSPLSQQSTPTLLRSPNQSMPLTTENESVESSQAERKREIQETAAHPNLSMTADLLHPHFTQERADTVDPPQTSHVFQHAEHHNESAKVTTSSEDLQGLADDLCTPPRSRQTQRCSLRFPADEHIAPFEVIQPCHANQMVYGPGPTPGATALLHDLPPPLR